MGSKCIPPTFTLEEFVNASVINGDNGGEINCVSRGFAVWYRGGEADALVVDDDDDDDMGDVREQEGKDEEGKERDNR
ncbi:hypothetical protein BGZ76_005791 [Entomortierella beljakovae]|nr:hypothetical protein BGZ76_005791 [Entomortierella beljakovae]